MSKDILEYNKSQPKPNQLVCEKLMQEINKALEAGQSKVWHAHPVWFIDGNPIVGYTKRKEGVSLMFWSGQSFDDPELKPSGSFKAAEIKYFDVSEIDTEDLARWLEKSKTIQWDYKNIVKRKGVLERLDNL